MKKRHFVNGVITACNRDVVAGTWTARGVSDTTCLNCKGSRLWLEASAKDAAERAAAFEAQVPRSFNEPWKSGVPMVCKGCGGFLFRDAGRSCHGHYQDFTCSDCGHIESRLTETGMSF
jgi:hypothetical protein